MLHMIVEQTYKYPMRMCYQPETGNFCASEYKSLQYERHFTKPYGWIKESGTPPEPHWDCILMSDNAVELGDEVVFLAKSVGTVEAGWLAEKLDIKVQQIFLTPMKEALSYCTGMAKVVIGTADSVYAMYKEYCDKEKVDTLYIKDGNHSLEVVGKPYESIEMLKKVLEFIEKKRYTEEFLD